MLGQVYLISKSTMRYIKKTALLAAVLLILSACGQRGALYNPETAPIENSSTENESDTPEKTPSITTEGA
jgi:predicted small lipoprotein YifL